MKRPSRPRVSCAAIVAFLLATPASAEVMDKEYTVPEVWAYALVGAAVGGLATRYRPWLALLTLPLAAYVPANAVLESYDPGVGPAIHREAGMAYVIHAHSALALVVGLHVLFAVLRVRQALKPSHVGDPESRPVSRRS